MTRIKSLILKLKDVVGLVILIAMPSAYASDFVALDRVKQPFTAEAYQAAKANNKTYLIDVYADWCSTCKRQQRVLNAYFEQNPNSEIIVFEVDFDTQKEWVTYFKAPRQSTLALYRGEEQLWFSVAQTRQRTIFNALNQSGQ